MHPDLVSALRCPVCGDALGLTDRTASCPNGHSYDLAKQGYLNLLPLASTGIEGDSAAMVEARSTFLDHGHYAPIRDALIAHTPGEGLIVEVGAGTAYYLAGVVAAEARPTRDRAGRVPVRRAQGREGRSPRSAR